jgi:hypothetical protein
LICGTNSMCNLLREPLFVVQCNITPVQLLHEENNKTVAFAAPKMCSQPRSPRTTYLPSDCINTSTCLALCASWNAAPVGLPSVCLMRACMLLRRRVSLCVGRSCPGSSHTLCVPRPALSFPTLSVASSQVGRRCSLACCGSIGISHALCKTTPMRPQRPILGLLRWVSTTHLTIACHRYLA